MTVAHDRVVMDAMRFWSLAKNVQAPMAGVAFIPVPIELLGDEAQLDDQLAREVCRLDFAALFAPKAEQGGFVAPHNDPGVGAADAVTTTGRTRRTSRRKRHRVAPVLCKPMPGVSSIAMPLSIPQASKMIPGDLY